MHIIIKYKKILAAITLALNALTATAQSTIKSGDLIVNEIQVCNIDMFLDPSINYGGWIELYNTTDLPIRFYDLFITDDENNLRKFPIKSTVGKIPAHGFRNLWFDHFGIWTVGEYKMIGFKLNREGGEIIISDGENILVRQSYPAAMSRLSYARTTDGGDEWGWSGNPTPEESNEGMVFATERVPEPVPDRESQRTKRMFAMNVSIPEGATVRYTTDGSIPTMENGKTLLSSIITVTGNTVVRMRSYKEGYLPSDVVTRSFIYDSSGKYRLPIVSVVTDKDNIYSSDHGVFETGPNGVPGNGRNDNCNWNRNWDRPVHFDYFDENGVCQISQMVDLLMCGGWSRAFLPHSFKLSAEKTYEGLNSLDYQFFSAKPYLKHKTLQLRNGGNDHHARIKDAALQEIVRRSGLYVETQSWQPVHVFINGSYHAVLNMREPNNKHYAYANYGIDPDEMDQFEINPDSNYVQMAGTKDAFLELYELCKQASDDDTYEKIKQLLDIDEFINYMAVEFYLGNWDWPQNNCKAFRDRNNGRFRFTLFDLDGSFSTDSPFATFKSKQTRTFDKIRHGDVLGLHPVGTHKYEEVKLVTMFGNLMKNKDFERQFVDAFCIIGGSVFEPERCKKIINEMVSTMSSAGVSSGATANDIKNQLSDTRQENMFNQLNGNGYTISFRNNLKKSLTLQSNIDGAKLAINGLPVPTGYCKGRFFAPLKFTAEAPAGYRFVGWRGIGAKSIDNKASALSGYITTDTVCSSSSASLISITAVFEPLTEEERLASQQPPVVINEVSAGNTMFVNDYFKKDDWIELYNTTDEPIDIAGAYLSDNASKPQKYQIPADRGEATIIPPHGYLIVWASKRDDLGEQLHANFKLGNNDGERVILTSADGLWSHTLEYTQHDGTESVGLYPDGGRNVYLMKRPTIAASNALTTESPYIYNNVRMHLTSDVEGTPSDAAVISQQYFSPGGIPLGTHTSALPSGIYILRQNLADGTVRSMRIRL